MRAVAVAVVVTLVCVFAPSAAAGNRLVESPFGASEYAAHRRSGGAAYGAKRKVQGPGTGPPAEDGSASHDAADTLARDDTPTKASRNQKTAKWDAASPQEKEQVLAFEKRVDAWRAEQKAKYYQPPDGLAHSYNAKRAADDTSRPIRMRVPVDTAGAASSSAGSDLNPIPSVRGTVKKLGNANGLVQPHHAVRTLNDGAPTDVSFVATCKSDSKRFCGESNPFLAGTCIQLHHDHVTPLCAEYNGAKMACFIDIARLDLCKGQPRTKYFGCLFTHKDDRRLSHPCATSKLLAYLRAAKPHDAAVEADRLACEGKMLVDDVVENNAAVDDSGSTVGTGSGATGSTFEAPSKNAARASHLEKVNRKHAAWQPPADNAFDDDHAALSKKRNTRFGADSDSAGSGSSTEEVPRKFSTKDKEEDGKSSFSRWKKAASDAVDVRKHKLAGSRVSEADATSLKSGSDSVAVDEPPSTSARKASRYDPTTPALEALKPKGWKWRKESKLDASAAVKSKVEALLHGSTLVPAEDDSPTTAAAWGEKPRRAFTQPPSTTAADGARSAAHTNKKHEALGLFAQRIERPVKTAWNAGQNSATEMATPAAKKQRLPAQPTQASVDPHDILSGSGSTASSSDDSAAAAQSPPSPQPLMTYVQACRADTKRLCDMLNPFAASTCLEANMAKLSATCRAYTEGKKACYSALAVKKVCLGDETKNLFKCLNTHRDDVRLGPACSGSEFMAYIRSRPPNS